MTESTLHQRVTSLSRVLLLCSEQIRRRKCRWQNLHLRSFTTGDKYDIMGRTVAELLLRGADDDDQTQVELCLIKHALLAEQRMAWEGDEVRIKRQNG